MPIGKLNERRIEDVFGFGDGRIIGGKPTTIEAHPHQVSLRIYDEHICGASIISPIRLLTAGHCLIPYAPAEIYSVLAGTTEYTGGDNDQLRNVLHFARHPGYEPNKGSKANDFGVLEVKTPFEFGSNVRAIALPPQGAQIPDDAIVTITGWGVIVDDPLSPLALTLQVATLPIISNERCNVMYPGRVTPEMLCAGQPEGGQDACQGDSGGPLVFEDVLHGVVSFGRGCAQPASPGVYARVSSAIKWITELEFN